MIAVMLQQNKTNDLAITSPDDQSVTSKYDIKASEHMWNDMTAIYVSATFISWFNS